MAPSTVDLRRAGLAADAVALDVGVAAAAVGDDVLQKPPHGVGRLLRDGLAAHHGLPPFDDRAVFGAYLLGDVGLKEFAAVDHRAGSSQKLDGRDGHGLAKTDAGEVDAADHAFVYDDAAALAGMSTPVAEPMPKRSM